MNNSLKVCPGNNSSKTEGSLQNYTSKPKFSKYVRNQGQLKQEDDLESEQHSSTSKLSEPRKEVAAAQDAMERGGSEG